MLHEFTDGAPQRRLADEDRGTFPMAVRPFNQILAIRPRRY
jgi:hypothetical protein